MPGVDLVCIMLSLLCCTAGLVHHRKLPLCSCEGGPWSTCLSGICQWPLSKGCGVHQKAPHPSHDPAAATKQGFAGKQIALRKWLVSGQCCKGIINRICTSNLRRYHGNTGLAPQLGHNEVCFALTEGSAASIWSYYFCL